MANIWPWLAIAGAGALHGLNPVNGWVFAAASAVRSRTRPTTLRTLLPIAAGHAASIALVAAALVLGLAIDRAVLQGIALTLLGAAAILHLSVRAAVVRVPAGRVGIALWSFVMSTAHGAGLMMVPALMPLCGAGAFAASTSLTLALAAVAVHTTAMLAAAGAASVGTAGVLARVSCVRNAGCAAAACRPRPAAA
jgi:hypothetical protein